MKKKPLISIIVPCYNVEPYLKECLDSLINQTYKNIEIIIINDGSTDKTKEIIDTYSRKHDIIHVIHQDNAGLSEARNVGIKESSGQFIALVDSDDSVSLKFIEKLYVNIETDGSDICVCGFNNNVPNKKCITGQQALMHLLMEQENIDILAWNKLYKKELFTEHNISYPKGKIHEDNLTTYKLYSKAKKISYINESLYNYRIREGSIMKTQKKLEHLQAREQAARESIIYLKNCDNEIRKAANTSLLLAKYAILDNAIRGSIDKKYKNQTIAWIRQHDDFKRKCKVTKKLRFYNALINIANGIPYTIFRKIIHE